MVDARIVELARSMSVGTEREVEKTDRKLPGFAL